MFFRKSIASWMRGEKTPRRGGGAGFGDVDEEGFNPEDATYGAMMEASASKASGSRLISRRPRALEVLVEALHDRESSFVILYGAGNPIFCQST